MNQASHLELRFQSLFNPGMAMSFPCDAQGHVDMDTMSDRVRSNYLLARALVGRDFSVPYVRTCAAGVARHELASRDEEAAAGEGAGPVVAEETAATVAVRQIMR